MARRPRDPDDAIARFDEWAHRLDGNAAQVSEALRRDYGPTVKAAGKRVLGAGAALAALMVAVLVYSLVVGPIGLWGFMLMLLAAVLIAGFMLFRPAAAPKRFEYNEQQPTRQLVQQFDSYLVRQRKALPAPAVQRVDAISRQLPLLESRLGEVDALDPLAQDARRLMGKHLPELIDRYERVPAQYRGETDGDGLTVDQRLVAGLDAAKQALDDIGSKLARQDLNAFETQGRFIESRYKDDPALRDE